MAGRFIHGSTLETLFQHGRMLEYMFGSVSHSGTTDQKHTFTENATIPSMTIEDGYNSDTDTVFRYAGCKVNNFTISLALDGVLTWRADLIGKTVATSTSASAAVIDTLEVLPDFHGVLKTGAAGSEATIGALQTCEITMRNDLEPQYQVGTRLLQDLQANERHYGFTFTMIFSNAQEYGRFLAGTTSSTAPDAEGTATIPSVIFDINNDKAVNSGLRQFYINFTNASYATVRKPLIMRGYIVQDFEGWARTLSDCYTYDDITSGIW